MQRTEASVRVRVGSLCHSSNLTCAVWPIAGGSSVSRYRASSLGPNSGSLHSAHRPFTISCASTVAALNEGEDDREGEGKHEGDECEGENYEHEHECEGEGMSMCMSASVTWSSSSTACDSSRSERITRGAWMPAPARSTAV